MTPAKPRPCKSPKRKTTIGLHIEIFFKKIFSIATYEIDNAIIGSTIEGGIAITSSTPKKMTQKIEANFRAEIQKLTQKKKYLG